MAPILTLVMPNIFMYYTPPQFLSCYVLPEHSSCRAVFSVRVENSVDPDQKPSDLDLALQCFQKWINQGSVG